MVTKTRLCLPQRAQTIIPALLSRTTTAIPGNCSEFNPPSSCFNYHSLQSASVTMSLILGHLPGPELQQAHRKFPEHFRILRRNWELDFFARLPPPLKAPAHFSLELMVALVNLSNLTRGKLNNTYLLLGVLVERRKRLHRRNDRTIFDDRLTLADFQQASAHFELQDLYERAAVGCSKPVSLGSWSDSKLESSSGNATQSREM
jgi:hypothetical protein